ncbi:glycosyltransferase family 2 protein [Rheinheimera mangrovi]|uniref:glycosyltransferase family 2 protein n=1 Tax=Rheinheimera mangrovi TaxID=2498451 RepID=UPI000F8EE531|nr:glycosyltransferase [Rheinheimera mangrovi]
MKLNALSPIEFIIDNPDWSISQQSAQSILLLCTQPQSQCWFEVVIEAKEQSGFLEQNIFYLHQNNNPHGVDLHTEHKQHKSLIFFRHNPLTKLELRWTKAQQLQTSPVLKFTIRQLNTTTAIFRMLKFISIKDKANAVQSSRIYRKSYARWRKLGYQGALERLIREYKHLLTHQLISCEPYQYWQQEIETRRKFELLNEQPTESKSFEFVLLIKIPQQTTLLQESLNSIRQQSYANWRVLLLSETQNRDDKKWQPLLDAEPRIDIMQSHQDFLFKKNQFVIKMAAGDQLSPDALELCAHRLMHKPEIKILYTDHDVLDAEHQRSEPAFKPDWNPELFLSTNYMAPAVFLSTELMQLKNPKDPLWFKQNSYLWLLQNVGKIATSDRFLQIDHLPAITYHQSHVNHERSYSKEKRELIQQAMSDFLQNDKEQVLNIGRGKTNRSFRARFKIPQPLPLVSIIIPTRDMLDVLQQCIKSILDNTSYPHFEILIIDNQSSEPQTLQWFDTITSDPRIRVVDYPYPFNFSAINNYGVSEAKGSIVAMVNNDVEIISADWLTDMVQHALRPGVGAVGAKLYYFDDTVQHGGVVLGLWGLAGHAHKNYKRTSDGYLQRLNCTQNYSAVTAACLVVMKEKYLEVGGLNETDLAVAFNDVDFCLKLSAKGYRHIWTPYAELYHYESKSRGPEDSPEKKARERKEIQYMKRTWKTQLKYDPHYSLHLTRVREDFSIGIEG